MPAVFIPQSMLDTWADQGQVSLEDTTLSLLKEQRSVKLNPAVRFIAVIGDEADPHQLKGKVKTTEQLKEMGAEHYMDSVILGDVGYQVVEGFMGDLTRPAAAAADKSPDLSRSVTRPPQPAAAFSDVTEPGGPEAGNEVPRPITLAPQPAEPDPAPEKANPTPSGGIENAVSSALHPDVDDEGESDAEALSRLFLETVQ